MKRPILIIRFGNPLPLKGDQEAVMEMCDLDDETTKYDAMGAGHTSGMITLVMTTKTLSEIQEIYNRMAAKYDTVFPIFATVLDPNAKEQAIDFQTKGIEEMLVLFWEKQGFAKDYKDTWTMDELLDRVQEVGMKGLTDEERKALDILSKNNN